MVLGNIYVECAGRKKNYVIEESSGTYGGYFGLNWYRANSANSIKDLAKKVIELTETKSINLSEDSKILTSSCSKLNQKQGRNLIQVHSSYKEIEKHKAP
ncbi:hypothetical protein JXB27_03465, partial [Candidatus Woesearchaeota archaeon]|nr:hypothetical protein [Candidatus Woesearchaeota archaeon]